MLLPTSRPQRVRRTVAHPVRDTYPASLPGDKLAPGFAITWLPPGQATISLGHGEPTVTAYGGCLTSRGLLDQILVSDSDTSASRLVRAHEALHAHYTTANHPSHTVWRGVSKAASGTVRDVFLHVFTSLHSQAYAKEDLAKGAAEVVVEFVVLFHKFYENLREQGIEFQSLPYETRVSAGVEIFRSLGLCEIPIVAQRVHTQLDTLALPLVPAYDPDKTAGERLTEFFEQVLGFAAGLPDLEISYDKFLGRIRGMYYKRAAQAFDWLFPPDVAPEEKHKYDPKTKSGKIQPFDPSTYTVQERRLPLTERTARIAQRRFTDSAPRLHVPALPTALATGNASRLFYRRVRRPLGGTVLIDASGSMNLSAEKLAKLSELAPAASIYAYSGTDYKTGVRVTLAENGYRAASSEVNELNMPDGNCIDRYCLHKLLKSPGPRTFITDGGFCGADSDDEGAAISELDSAVRSGEVRWYPTVEAALRDWAFYGPG